MNKGKILDHSGKSLDFPDIRTVKTTTIDYLNRMRNETPEKLQFSANRLASKHLLMIVCNLLKLEKACVTKIHLIAVMSLFLCKRARSVLQLTVGF